MSIEQTLESLLVTATGAKVFPLERPANVSGSVIIYRIITDKDIIAQGGSTGLHKFRLQLTCVADSYGNLKTLVASTKQALLLNQTNFHLSYPIDTNLESKEDNYYFSVIEYYIWN